MAQLLIEVVTLLKSDRLHVHIRFKGGATDALALPLPKSAWRQRLTHFDVVALVDQYVELYDDDQQLAERLNAQCVHTGAGSPFDAAAVRWVRYVHGLADHQRRLRARGKLPLRELAAQQGLGDRAVRQMARDGRVNATRSGRKAMWLTEPLDAQPAEIQQLARRHEERPGSATALPRGQDTAPHALRARIEPLVLDGHDDAAIAEILNADGWQRARGAAWHAASAHSTRERCGIKTLWAQQLANGKLTSSQMAALLGFGLTTIESWAHTGRLRGTRCGTGPKARWALEPLDAQPDEARRLADKRATLPRYHGVLSAAAAGRGAP